MRSAYSRRAFFLLVTSLGVTVMVCSWPTASSETGEDGGGDGQNSASDSGPGLVEATDAGKPELQAADAGRDAGVPESIRMRERCDAGVCRSGYCHSATNTCLESCGSCPATSMRCAGEDGGATVDPLAQYCQCVVDRLCDRESPGWVCQRQTRACGPPCNVESCPTGYQCSPTGHCVP